MLLPYQHDERGKTTLQRAQPDVTTKKKWANPSNLQNFSTAQERNEGGIHLSQTHSPHIKHANAVRAAWINSVPSVSLSTSLGSLQQSHSPALLSHVAGKTICRGMNPVDCTVFWNPVFLTSLRPNEQVWFDSSSETHAAAAAASSHKGFRYKIPYPCQNKSSTIRVIHFRCWQRYRLQSVSSKSTTLH